MQAGLVFQSLFATGLCVTDFYSRSITERDLRLCGEFVTGLRQRYLCDLVGHVMLGWDTTFTSAANGELRLKTFCQDQIGIKPPVLFFTRSFALYLGNP